MRRYLTPLTLILLLLVLAACGRSAGDELSVSQEAGFIGAPSAPMEMPAAEEAMDMAFYAEGEVSRTLTETVQEAGQERLIIRSADLDVIVTDTAEAMRTITDMVNEAGGWVVNSSVYQYDESAMTGNMAVRVPAAGFDSFLDAVSGLAVEVTRISTSGQDVTEEYVDLAARLRNLEATAERLRALLDEARTVKDTLEVSRELSVVEGEIEALKGRMQYLEQSSAFSAVSINFTPDVLAQPLEVGGWQPQGVARAAIESLVDALQTLADVAIWFAIFVLPLLLLVGVPAYLVIRAARRRRAARKSAAGGAAPADPAA